MRPNGRAEIVGRNPLIVELLAEIDRVARTDAKVLITGESGTGKELVARALHARSYRSQRLFVPVNCAGLPETLLESELFGHLKGSFTGAYRDKAGKLELADQGTMLLDEIGEMTLHMQGLLLRFLETGELQKVGSERVLGTVNVRVIAATNRDLRQLVTEGAFREDLFYRINVIHLIVPPLRERREDIPILIDQSLKRFSQSNRTPAPTFDSGAMAALMDYSWPGNVRELENAVERIVVSRRKDVISVEDLPADMRERRSMVTSNGKATRESLTDNLYKRLIEQRESFWTTVYPLYMHREITRSNVRELVGRGLVEARGNYKIVARLFNLEPSDYKKFLNFLRKHECQLPFRDYR
jgi:two-component system response regulator AtoC